eukprot:4652948-Prymnesium_polylepis.1
MTAGYVPRYAFASVGSDGILLSRGTFCLPPYLTFIELTLSAPSRCCERDARWASVLCARLAGRV